MSLQFKIHTANFYRMILQDTTFFHLMTSSFIFCKWNLHDPIIIIISNGNDYWIVRGNNGYKLNPVSNENFSVSVNLFCLSWFNLPTGLLMFKEIKIKTCFVKTCQSQN